MNAERRAEAREELKSALHYLDPSREQKGVLAQLDLATALDHVRRAELLLGGTSSSRIVGNSKKEN